MQQKLIFFELGFFLLAGSTIDAAAAERKQANMSVKPAGSLMDLFSAPEANFELKAQDRDNEKEKQQEIDNRKKYEDYQRYKTELTHTIDQKACAIPGVNAGIAASQDEAVLSEDEFDAILCCIARTFK